MTGVNACGTLTDPNLLCHGPPRPMVFPWSLPCHRLQVGGALTAFDTARVSGFAC